jgi:hypothetical protein
MRRGAHIIAMTEIIIERWKGRDGRVEFLWSIWRDGKRHAMGQPLDSADAAEAAARDACRRAMRLEPDRVTRL